MRIALIRLSLFFVPFVLYFGFLVLSRRLPREERMPWTVLVISGLALVAASFIWLGLTEGESVQGVYVAPHVVNGKIVPGHVEKQP